MVLLRDQRWRDVLEGLLGVRFGHLVHVFWLIYDRPGWWPYKWLDAMVFTDDEMFVAELQQREGMVRSESGCLVERTCFYFGLALLVDNGESFIEGVYHKLRDAYGF